jgi:hypothetical protein
MLAKLCAIVLLALAVSPLTAPFQTCSETYATVVFPFNSGSQIGPVAMRAKHSTAPVALPIAFGMERFRLVTTLTSNCSSQCDGRTSFRQPTVLRIESSPPSKGSAGSRAMPLWFSRELWATAR